MVEMNVSYFFYDNWIAEGHKARVHLGYCSFCNDGKGIHPGASTKHGIWHGPFDNRKKVVSAAQASGGVVSFCKWCKP